MNDANNLRLARLERRLLHVKRGLTGFAALGIFGWGTTVFAADDWAPDGFHVFKAGEPAVAADVNENFRWLVEHVEALEAQQANSPPIGTIVAFAGETAPDGWLLCNGQVIAEADHPALAALLGRAWDAEDRSIRVPDLRGRFLRGVDGGAGLDDQGADRLLGSYQDDAMQRIEGTVPNVMLETANNVAPTGVFSWTGVVFTNGGTNEDGDHRAMVTLDTADDPRLKVSDSETRPANAAVNFIIKT